MQAASAARSSALPLKIAVCLFLAWLADFLFFGHELGWTLGLFGFALLANVAFFNRTHLRTLQGKAAFLLTLGLCGALVEAPGILSVLLFASGVFTIIGVPVWHVAGGLGSHLLRIVSASGLLPFRLPRDYFTWRRTSQWKNGTNLFTMAKGWVLPALFFAVFVALFVRANPVLEKWWDIIAFEPVPPSPTHVVFWAIAVLLIWGTLRPWIVHFQGLETTGIRQLAAPLLSDEAIPRTLLVFNALFLLQNVMDAAFLWGGTALPEGLTYAEYAHRGAYPLIVTSLFAAFFVLLTLRPQMPAPTARKTTLLIYIWLVQNMVLVLSSIWRTKLYIEQYSLSYLRYAALIWMVLVLLGLLLIIVRILLNRSNLWLVNANLAVLFAVLYVNCFFDNGRFIAFYNVTHSREATGSGIALDYDYLLEIGPSALPALQWLRHNGKELPKVGVENILRRRLAYSLATWRGWKWRHHRISLKLDATPSAELPASPFTAGGNGFFYAKPEQR